MRLHYKYGDGGGILDRLRKGPVECCLIGASVTAQRQGWGEKLIGKICADTGHSHRAVRNAMGGVGLLFGVAHQALMPHSGQPRIAFIEFSTGDLNLGLTPPDLIPHWLDELLSVLQSEDTPAVIVHNWRSDFPSDDGAGIRRAYDDVASRYGVPVIENQRMVVDRLQSGDCTQQDWFRDLCHTTDMGAEAYAEHVWRCLQDMAYHPRTPGLPLPPEPAPDQRISVHGLANVPVEARRGSFVYANTGQLFSVLTVEADQMIAVRARGRLLGAAFISGPRSGWATLAVNGRVQKKLRLFDRHSYYERYVLLPTVLELDNDELQLRTDDAPVDFEMASRPHPDFSLPRSLAFVHLIGAGLQLGDPVLRSASVTLPAS